jgi:hypothetical protein
MAIPAFKKSLETRMNEALGKEPNDEPLIEREKALEYITRIEKHKMNV